MGAYDKFKVDVGLEKKGIVLDFTEFRITIARAGGNNKRYDKVLEAKSRPYLRAIQTETMDNERAEQLLKEVYADCVVLNWEVLQKDGKYKKGIEDPTDGKLLPFKPENIVKVLNAPELKDLWIDIRNQAQKASLFRASIEEARAGN